MKLKKYHFKLELSTEHQGAHNSSNHLNTVQCDKYLFHWPVYCDEHVRL